MTATLENKIEIWKKIVDTQIHFNDLQLRIRNMAITALGVVLGVVGVVSRDGLTFAVGIPLLILALGMWGAFWFMDDIWYHRLLRGAVNAGQEAENEIMKEAGIGGLTNAIGAASPIVVCGKSLHSKDKMRLFYLVGAIFISGLILGVAAMGHVSSPTPISLTPPAQARSSVEPPSAREPTGSPTPTTDAPSTAAITPATSEPPSDDASE